MRNVLVTGGAGFIGSNFIRFLLNEEPDVKIVNLDALTYAGSLENLRDLPDPSRYQFIHGSINDRSLIDQLLRKQEIDTIVHFAAETHVDRSILGPAQFVETNVVGTFILLEAARTTWLDEIKRSPEEVRFHHISTDEVFGSLEPDDPPFSENTSYAPNSPYAASKAASDHLVRSYGHTYGLPYSITNCSNNYGPYQFPEKLIPLMISNAFNGLPLPIYGDGKQIRDWLYVEDHCEAIRDVIKIGKSGETYIVGGNTQPTNLKVINTLCEILDECLPQSEYSPHESLIEYVVDRPGHDRRYAMDITKINNDLGWSPRQSLSEGLLKTVEWYLDHQDWIAAIGAQGDYQDWLEKNYQARGGDQ
ncbi:MAG TPA: dTDP-glucose 4,6-dehydratase [Anaerolineales bacterium]|jgi:dTDP-glucose 4,6-dehydratase|nr:dTDP-glucose 4,6-dehydratase [Anaerolineales bacterium]